MEEREEEVKEHLAVGGAADAALEEVGHGGEQSAADRVERVDGAVCAKSTEHAKERVLSAVVADRGGARWMIAESVGRCWRCHPSDGSPLR